MIPHAAGGGTHMAALPSRATTFLELNEQFLISDELIGRLYRSSEDAVLEIAARMSPRDRARLAVFCYGKAHLHAIGLTLASGCELAALTEVMGNAVGQAIFDQARARAALIERAAPTRRPSKITLATFTAKATPDPHPEMDDPAEPIAEPGAKDLLSVA
jgi:hypothetical protein